MSSDQSMSLRGGDEPVNFPGFVGPGDNAGSDEASSQDGNDTDDSEFIRFPLMPDRGAIPAAKKGDRKLAERQTASSEAVRTLGYHWVEKTALHENLTEHFGIDESLLAPLTPEQPPGGRRGHSRSLERLARQPPSRMRFAMAWPRDKELSGAWFEILYTHLYARTFQLAERYFTYKHIPFVPPWDSLWVREDFSPQFVYYAGLVARGDAKTGGWETVLRKSYYRQYLIMGIIGKVLETSVFNELLFGADDNQAALLKAQDEATLHLEGYVRTGMRADSVRAVLCEALLPPLFWQRVDELSLQLVTLLLPAIKLLDGCFAASRGASLRAVHQEVHHIVAEAAYLSVGMRWSKTIFRLRTPLPGETNDGREQQHVDARVWDQSDAAAKREDQALEAAWRAEQAAKPADERPDDDAMFFPPSRIAKVQIVAWPSLQRFAAGSPDGNVPEDKGRGKGKGKARGRSTPRVRDGEYRSWLFKAAVVYYSGRVSAEYDGEEAHPTLRRWIWRARWSTLLRRGPRFRVLFPLLTVWFLLLAIGLIPLPASSARGQPTSLLRQTLRDWWHFMTVTVFGWLVEAWEFFKAPYVTPYPLPF